MFYKKDLPKFKNFIFNNFRSIDQGFQHRYVFLEDDNAIVTLHGIPIKLQSIPAPSGQICNVWVSPNANYPNLYIIKLLHYLIRFKPIQHSNGASETAIKSTFLGGYDMNTIPLTSVISSNTLAPSITNTDQIYINDLAFKSSPTYFLDQFLPTLWISFLLSFLLCGLVLHFGNLCLKKLSSGPFNSFSWVSIIARQGGDETLWFNSRNIILITLGILTNIFHDSFEAFLSSSLSIRVFDLPFSDLNGLLNTKDYTICTILHTASYDYIRAAKNIRINVKHNSQDCPLFHRNYNPVSKSNETNITKCPDGKVAYMGLGKDWKHDWSVKCNILPLAEKYFTKYVTINVSPGFKYREHFNMGILLLRSGGHLHQMKGNFDMFSYFKAGVKHGRYKHIDQHENIAQPINISQTIIIQMILLAGIFISVLIAVAEIVIKRLF